MNTVKALKSYAGTPLRSGTQTPVARDEYTAGVVSEELYSRLEALAQGRTATVAGGEPTKRDAFSLAIEWLATDRGKASLEERENSLLTVLSVLATRFEPELLDAGLVENVAKAVLSARSELEAVVALQILAVAASQLDDEHDGFDRCHEVFGAFVPKLLKRIQDKDGSPSQRAQMLTGYSVLQYFMNYGGGGFNVDALCEELFSIAEATTAAESSVAAAALMGIGLIMTLANDTDATIEELVPAIPPFFEIPDLEVRIAATKLTGLFFEKYQLRDVDAQELKDILHALLTESARRSGKKDQHQRKSLARDALSTIDGYESGVKSEASLTRMNLSRSKSINIRSWNDLFIIQHLKWTFGPGLHTQLANNPLVSSIFETDDDDSAQDPDIPDEEHWEQNAVTRGTSRRRERFNKLERQGRIGDA